MAEKQGKLQTEEVQHTSVPSNRSEEVMSEPTFLTDNPASW